MVVVASVVVVVDSSVVVVDSDVVVVMSAVVVVAASDVVVNADVVVVSSPTASPQAVASMANAAKTASHELVTRFKGFSVSCALEPYLSALRSKPGWGRVMVGSGGRLESRPPCRIEEDAAKSSAQPSARRRENESSDASWVGGFSPRSVSG